MTDVIPQAPSLVSQIVDLWPLASTGAAAAVAWVTANWRGRRVAEAKTAELIDGLRERAHKTEVELGQIRAVLAAATGLKFEEITLHMIQEMVHRKSVTLQELETFVLTMPRLMWIKRREGKGLFRMIQVSQVYADKYLGGDALTYAGRTDSEIWPADIAAAFAINDEAACKSGETIEIDEKLSTVTGIHGRLVGVKWSFKLGQDIYVCGLGAHEAD